MTDFKQVNCIYVTNVCMHEHALFPLQIHNPVFASRVILNSKARSQDHDACTT